jgi:hypothetical protein
MTSHFELAHVAASARAAFAPTKAVTATAPAVKPSAQRAWRGKNSDMSITESNQLTATARPRLWWRLVVACTGLYVLLLAINYVVPWLNGSKVMWAGAEILLVAFAGFAAAKDLSSAGPRRPLRRTERIALMVVVLLVLLWLAGLMLTWAASGDRASFLRALTGLIVAIPVIPVAALALPGTLVFRRAP